MTPLYEKSLYSFASFCSCCPSWALWLVSWFYSSQNNAHGWLSQFTQRHVTPLECCWSYSEFAKNIPVMLSITLRKKQKQNQNNPTNQSNKKPIHNFLYLSVSYFTYLGANLFVFINTTLVKFKTPLWDLIPLKADSTFLSFFPLNMMQQNSSLHVYLINVYTAVYIVSKNFHLHGSTCTWSANTSENATLKRIRGFLLLNIGAKLPRNRIWTEYFQRHGGHCPVTHFITISQSCGSISFLDNYS